MTTTLIAASGTAELHVPPDRATLRLAIRTTDPDSLRDAARECAPIEREVLAALARAGVPRDRIATLRYDTGRERDYTPSGYVHGDYYVEHVLSVEVHELETVGAVIAAARAAGATRVAGIAWWVSEEESYREQATRDAVHRAFTRARTLADAAGTTLGRVVRLGTPEALAATLGAGGADRGYGGMIMSEASSPAGLDEDDESEEPLILPVPITIQALVHGAWEVDAGA